MKLSILAVVSIDGKLTDGANSNIHSWTSAEDLAHYKEIIGASNLIIMGVNTYKVMHPKLIPGKLYVVLTSNPEQYAEKAVEGQLEFTSEPPGELIKRLEGKGYKEGIINGGGRTNGEFMAAGLITDISLTIEPVALGEGTELFGGVKQGTKMHLESVSKLNDRGTLLLYLTTSVNSP